MGKNKGNKKEKTVALQGVTNDGYFFLCVSFRMLFGGKKERLYKMSKIMLKPTHQEIWKVARKVMDSKMGRGP